MTADLRSAGLAAETGWEWPSDGDQIALVLVVGGAAGSRRDGFGALVDAVTWARSSAPAASVIARIPAPGDAEAVAALLASGADDVLIETSSTAVLLARA